MRENVIEVDFESPLTFSSLLDSFPRLKGFHGYN